MSYNWKNLLNNQNLCEPSEPELPGDLTNPYSYPGPILDEQPHMPDVNINLNPFLQLLGVNANVPIIHSSMPDGPIMSVSQQRKVQNQYPALSSIFGTTPMSHIGGVMYENGGGGDEPVYPDENGTIHGGVEYPDGPTPEPDYYPYPEEYPDEYPDDYPPYPGDDDEGGNPPTRRKNNNNNQQQLENLQTAMNQVLAQTLRMASHSAQNANYFQANNDTHSFDYKESVQKVNNSLNALREANKIQQNHLDNFLNKVANEKNQDNYSNMLRQYAQMRDQAQASQELATRMAYAAENRDYKNIAVEVKNYTIPDPPVMPNYTPVNSNWQTRPDFNYPTTVRTLGSTQSTPVQYYYPTPRQTYAYNHMRPSYAPNVNPNTAVNNEFPKFTVPQSNTNPTGQGTSLQKAESAISDLIKTTMGGPFLNSDVGKLTMSLANQLLNTGAKDAADLMQLSIYGPQKFEANSEFTPIDKSLNDKLNQSLEIKGTGIEIPEKWDGVVFDKGSHLAQSLSNSEELKAQIKDFYNNQNNSSKTQIPVTFNEKNLKLAIHNATIINPKIDAQGNFTGILYDKYDFTALSYNNDFGTAVANNIAYLLQDTNILDNYYVLVPVKIENAR